MGSRNRGRLHSGERHGGADASPLTASGERGEAAVYSWERNDAATDCIGREVRCRQSLLMKIMYASFYSRDKEQKQLLIGPVPACVCREDHTNMKVYAFLISQQFIEGRRMMAL